MNLNKVNNIFFGQSNLQNEDLITNLGHVSHASPPDAVPSEKVTRRIKLYIHSNIIS